MTKQPERQVMAKGSTDKRFYIFAACVVVGLALIGLGNLYQAHLAAPHIQQLSYSQFLDDLAQGRVRTVTLTGHEIDGFLADHSPFRCYAADDPTLIAALRTKGVSITAVAPPAASPTWGGTLGTVLPMLLLVAFAIFFMTRGGAGGQLRGLGKSRARPLTQEHGRVTFADVAGVDEACDALKEMVQFLRDPHSFQRLGGGGPARG